MQLVKHILRVNNLSTCSGNPANQEQDHPSETASSNPVNHDESREIIDYLFLKLAATYGNAWRNLFKNHEFLQFSKGEWLEALSGFEENVLYDAVAVCRKNNPFPPTIPEFIECCKKARKKDIFFHREQSNTEPDRKVAHHHLNKIKTLLNMKSQ